MCNGVIIRALARFLCYEILFDNEIISLSMHFGDDSNPLQPSSLLLCVEGNVFAFVAVQKVVFCMMRMKWIVATWLVIWPALILISLIYSQIALDHNGGLRNDGVTFQKGMTYYFKKNFTTQHKEVE